MAKTDAERQAEKRERARMVAAGYVQVKVWTTKSAAAKAEKASADLVERVKKSSR